VVRWLFLTGCFAMPFLVIVLLFLLNSEKVEAAFRNRIFANALYADDS
jgi:hypothetical protein